MRGCLFFVLFLFLFAAYHPLLLAQPPNSVIMRFGGDCVFAGHYAHAVGSVVDSAFRGFHALRDADIGFVNLECPITTRGTPRKKPWSFRMDPSFLRALTTGGINVVNLANNHIFDYGTQGIVDAIHYLDSNGIAHVGAGRNRAEAGTPFIRDIRGFRVAIQGYYSGTEASSARDSVAGVSERTLNGIADHIRTWKTRDSASFVVISLHWGHENADTPSTDQVRFAHAVIDAGADAVIGHHAHVVQGLEVYKGKVIAYSLGNLIFGGSHKHSYDSGLLEIRLEPRGPQYRFLPVRVSHWHARLLTERDAGSIMARVKSLSSRFPKSIFTSKESP